MVKDNITTAQDVAEATGQDEEEIKEAWQKIEADQLEVANMEPNRITLNPRAVRSGELKCSRCGEKVVEISGHHENRFECGCDGLVEFEIPVKGNDGGDGLDLDDIIENDYTVDKEDDTIKCPICRGTGVTSVALGQFAGTVECDNCDGTGEVTSFNNV